MEGVIEQPKQKNSQPFQTESLIKSHLLKKLLEKSESNNYKNFIEIINRIVDCYFEYLAHIRSVAIKNQGYFSSPSSEEIINNLEALINEITKEHGGLINKFETESDYNQRGGIRLIFKNHGNTILKINFYFHGNNGYIVFPNEENIRKETVIIYRGVGNFFSREEQKSILSRYNPKLTKEEVKGLFEGKIKINKLIKKTTDPQLTRMTLEKINPEKPLEKMSLEELLNSIKMLHVCTERGGASFIFDPFISTSTDPLEAKEYAFPTNYDGDFNGVPGILVIEAPIESTFSIKDNEVGILMEIEPKWIKGFVPTTGNIKVEELKENISNIENYKKIKHD